MTPKILETMERLAEEYYPDEKVMGEMVERSHTRMVFVDGCKAAEPIWREAERERLKDAAGEFDALYQRWMSLNGSRSQSIRISLNWMFGQLHLVIGAMREELRTVKKERKQAMSASSVWSIRAEKLKQKNARLAIAVADAKVEISRLQAKLAELERKKA